LAFFSPRVRHAKFLMAYGFGEDGVTVADIYRNQGDLE
jgi:hypothetical protein